MTKEKIFPNLIVKQKLLLTTEDGVQLYNKADQVFVVSKKHPGSVQTVRVIDVINNKEKNKWCHFASRKALETFIENSTPVPVTGSDIYKISITELLFRNKGFDNVQDIKKLISNNGYYGRNRIRTVREQGTRTTKIKIDIYLPNSVYIYSWPLNTYYSLTDKNIIPLKKNKIKIDPAIRDFMYSLLEVTGNEDGEYDTIQWMKANVRVRSGFGFKRTDDVFNQLIHFGLIKNDKFVLKNEVDVTEVYNNLFSTKFSLI